MKDLARIEPAGRRQPEGTAWDGACGRGGVVRQRTVAPKRFARVEDRGKAQPSARLGVDEDAEVAPMSVAVRHDMVDHEHALQRDAGIFDAVRLTAIGEGVET